MVPMGRPGRLVSCYPPESVRPLRVFSLAICLMMFLLMLMAIFAGDTFTIAIASTLAVFMLYVTLHPDPLPRVHENGLVVNNPILGRRFYPWSMFYSYWIMNSCEGDEGHKTFYILVMATDTTVSIGHPMTNYRDAHELIERNVVWKSKPNAT
jgi:hypothetical protein